MPCGIKKTRSTSGPLQLQDHYSCDAADGEFHELLGDLSSPRSRGDTQHLPRTAAETGGDREGDLVGLVAVPANTHLDQFRASTLSHDHLCCQLWTKHAVLECT